MPRFLYIDKTWINVDLITHIDVKPGMANPAIPWCNVHFQGGGKPLSLSEDATPKLLEIVAKHQAE